MYKQGDPRELVTALLRRSICMVQVAALLEDRYGVYAWGWNHSGADGMGQHAEMHCLSRANWKRLRGSTLYVAARRKRNGRLVTAKPCIGCAVVLAPFLLRVVYRDGNGVWCD